MASLKLENSPQAEAPDQKTTTPEELITAIKKQLKAAEKSGREEDVLDLENQIRFLETKSRYNKINQALETAKAEARALEKEKKDPGAVEAEIYRLEGEKGELEKNQAFMEANQKMKDLNDAFLKQKETEDRLDNKISTPEYSATAAAIEQKKAAAIVEAANAMTENIKDLDINNLNERLNSERAKISLSEKQGNEAQVLAAEKRIHELEDLKRVREIYDEAVEVREEQYKRYQEGLYFQQQKIDQAEGDVKEKLLAEKKEMEYSFQNFVKNTFEPLKAGKDFMPYLLYSEAQKSKENNVVVENYKTEEKAQFEEETKTEIKPQVEDEMTPLQKAINKNFIEYKEALANMSQSGEQPQEKISNKEYEPLPLKSPAYRSRIKERPASNAGARRSLGNMKQPRPSLRYAASESWDTVKHQTPKILDLTKKRLAEAKRKVKKFWQSF